MSRCFPFPPPGFEKKDRTEDIDFLKKEKHKEKKHKKEKRDKEKREHKEKKDKDRSKDRHKEKKDRKEKHKEKIKDNDREKGSTLEDRCALEGTEGHNEFQYIESHLRGEVNDFKFTEELGRRTQDDGAATQLLGSSSNSVHRKFGDHFASSSLESHLGGEELKDFELTKELGRRTRDDGATTRLFASSPNSIHRNYRAFNIASSSQEKDGLSGNKVLGNQISSAQRRNDGSSLPTENVIRSVQRKPGSISITTTMEKERGKTPQKVTVGLTAQQYRNHGTSKSVDDLVRRKMESSNTTAGMEKEKYGEKRIFPNAAAPILEKEKPVAKFEGSNHISATQRKNDVLGKSVENLLANCKSSVISASSFHNTRTDGMGNVPAIEERANGNEISTFSFLVSSDQKSSSALSQPREKGRYQKIEWKEKVEDKKAQEKERHKEQDHNDKNTKLNEKDRQTKEKKKDSKDHVDIKPLAPHKDIKPSIGVDVTTKKRKFLETNGFLHENVARPDKMPRMPTSSHLPENCRLLEASSNNLKPDFHLGNKINGTTKSQHLPAESKPKVTRGLTENGEVPLISPHPDSKYLGIIYTVPKMDEYPEFDDQDWLFDGRDSRQKPKIEFEAKEVRPVWSEALRIDSTDDYALPYVVPF
ncbi:hypothetical protein AXF42_Ash006569 [Apostasia shenzhenica]|uniref:Uncharacterized protein n=1 Tax=Apostasia shenzhenica TaxID=1088818 RepID=A0A2I0AZI1_9ASPA|nr:hypothetical protein AXF42_Ash006569 [Apostasia shenzhenica]